MNLAKLFGLGTLALCAADARSGRMEAVAVDAGVVAISAGTIHLVEDGRVLEGGATILVRDGRILAVGSEVEVPPGAQRVDYGPDAVIVPGLVAPYSPYSTGRPSVRTASPGLRAVDSYDSYGTYGSAIAAGVTSAYVTPAENRLIAGQGALVKLGGEQGEGRIVNPAAALHGAIDSTARNAPGYWEPPIPATVDVGMDYQRPQLPKSTMGAIVALNELVAAAQAGDAETEYGPFAPRDLAAIMEAGLPWRITASEVPEIRAALTFSGEHELSLIIDKALGAKGVADEIAAAGAAVVFRIPYQPNVPFRDHGKGRDDRWPTFDVPAALVSAGVRVAVSGSSARDLLFAANLASRGGLDPAAALRSITLTPAELYGASGRVGSIRVGKDADLCVLNAPPLSGRASVLATWIDGKAVWSAHESGATVIQVDELHVGDGTVLRPGELLMQAGKIIEVAERVSHPRGATVVRGTACMPGMIDAFGHLGLEGSRKVPSTDYKLATIVGPGDEVDQRVAGYGITTVVLTPRGPSKTGAPIMAYKPAAQDLDRQVVGDPTALRVRWTAQNRLESGKDVRELLAKAHAYRTKWIEYEQAIASWTPPPPEPPKEEKEKDEDEEKEDEKDDDKKDDDKKKKKKKKGEEVLEPDPITGAWESPSLSPDEDDEDAEPEGAALKMRLLFTDPGKSGDVEGNLRCGEVSETLVEVEGYWDREENALRLSGLGSAGWVSVEAKVEEMRLIGTVSSDGKKLDIACKRTSKEYVVAGRQERRKEKEPEKKKAPKGKPKVPKLDKKLEPLRRAMEGKAAVVVEVTRDDEILDCIQAFSAVGIRPVLYGATDGVHVLDRIASRVAGALLSPQVLRYEAKRGTNYLTPYSMLQNAGIPVAFHSSAEEGAIDLPLAAAYAVSQGLSPTGAVRALTSDAAAMFSIAGRVGALERGLDADVLLLDGPPLAPGTSILRTWVNGKEVIAP